MANPFGGGGERTVIMPNPGGRRPNPAPVPAAPVTPSSQPAFVQPSFVPPPGGPGGQGGTDDWVRPEPPRPIAIDPDEQRRALVLKRDVVVAPNENPLLRAAGPLLLLLGRMRVQLSRASYANLMEQVAAAIEDFEKDVRQSGVEESKARTAKYIVAATADDIVQNIPTEDRHVWTHHSMLSRFFGERIGGVKFFEELERAKVDPSGNYHLLELFHACLALGFQGIHRTSGGGAAALQQIQRNLYELLRRTRQASREVSPRWQGQSIAATVARFQLPLWAVASVLLVLLFGLYLALRALLSSNAEAAATALVTVHPDTELGIQRRIYTPPPPPPPPAPESQAAQFTTALKDDVASGKLSIVESGNQVIVRLAAALFAPGDASVKPEYATLIQSLAKLLESQPGGMKVVGHTDSSPIHTVRFPSNFELSQERAKAVSQMIKTGLSKPDRVEVEGKGADVPIAPNSTVEGRAKNRRVEILIPRNS